MQWLLTSVCSLSSRSPCFNCFLCRLREWEISGFECIFTRPWPHSLLYSYLLDARTRSNLSWCTHCADAEWSFRRGDFYCCFTPFVIRVSTIASAAGTRRFSMRQSQEVKASCYFCASSCFRPSLRVNVLLCPAFRFPCLGVPFFSSLSLSSGH